MLAVKFTSTMLGKASFIMPFTTSPSSVTEKIGVACPKCGKDVVLKKTKKGRKYYGCIDNPCWDVLSPAPPSLSPGRPPCSGPVAG